MRCSEPVLIQNDKGEWWFNNCLLKFDLLALLSDVYVGKIRIIRWKHKQWVIFNGEKTYLLTVRSIFKSVCHRSVATLNIDIEAA